MTRISYGCFMWTHILIGMIGIILLAKATKTEEIDLSFLPQTTLGGYLAIELLKDGTVMTKPTTIIVGLMRDLNTKYDLPMEAYKLNGDETAFIIKTISDDRPFLIYQKSAIAEFNRQLISWNVEGILREPTNHKNPQGEVIGVQMSIGMDEDGAFMSSGLEWAREKDKKYGKYFINGYC